MPPVKLQSKVARLVLAVLAPTAEMSNARAEDVHTNAGQIFIRTEGGDNVKLSLVKVAIFDLKDYGGRSPPVCARGGRTIPARGWFTMRRGKFLRPRGSPQRTP
jgi:hypothetical protein